MTKIYIVQIFSSCLIFQSKTRFHFYTHNAIHNSTIVTLCDNLIWMLVSQFSQKMGLEHESLEWQNIYVDVTKYYVYNVSHVQSKTWFHFYTHNTIHNTITVTLLSIHTTKIYSNLNQNFVKNILFAQLILYSFDVNVFSHLLSVN